ncbi:BOS complex subunit ncln-like [Tubulanus polymorphus]|uniref:BOS complex subunit ncln-like n=1 Tax=Tubulanus polymorphus TaxID=672921 RepID=UPI003DA51FF6
MLWFDEAGEVVEMFRNSFPLSFLFFVPIFILISPVDHVGAAHDFTVYRMQQFDLQGSQYGCRNTLVSLDARHIDAKVLTRRCVLAKLKELTLDRFRDLKNVGAGALVVLLPSLRDKMTLEEKQHLMELESGLLTEETQMPVYFTPTTDELMDIYGSIRNSVNSDQASSATEALLSSATANGFQFVISGSQSKVKSDFKIPNIQGKLSGSGIEEQLPTIAIVAHYDAFGVAPGLSVGGDSNGSGVIALMEIARLFSKLYSNARTHAKFNFLFLLSGGGKFNYQGTKKWIEENLDNMESSLLTDVSFVLCLDTIGSEDELYLHVSKPPKDGSHGAIFLKNLESVSNEFYPEMKFAMNHKKINLANDMLAWEHERFSFRRLPAFTLSRMDSHRNLTRTSITDQRSSVDISKLRRNIHVMVEALARQVYGIVNTEQLEIFNDALDVQEHVISSWLDILVSQPRPAQLLDTSHPLINTMHDAMEQFLKDVKIIEVKADKRDPEYVFYDGEQFSMHAYNVKPAVFDLFLGLLIAGYIYLMYLLVQNFNWIRAVTKSVLSQKPKTQ